MFIYIIRFAFTLWWAVLLRNRRWHNRNSRHCILNRLWSMGLIWIWFLFILIYFLLFILDGGFWCFLFFLYLRRLTVAIFKGSIGYFHFVDTFLLGMMVVLFLFYVLTIVHLHLTVSMMGCLSLINWRNFNFSLFIYIVICLSHYFVGVRTLWVFIIFHLSIGIFYSFWCYLFCVMILNNLRSIFFGWRSASLRQSNSWLIFLILGFIFFACSLTS